MKYFSIFSGIGGFDLALNKSEHSCIGYSEIDKYAIQVYKKNFGVKVKNYGNATKIEPNNLPDFDLLVGGFPCFIKGTPVLTTNGYKKIEDITTLDYVITHLNNHRKVLQIMNREYKGNMNIIKLPYGTKDIICTPEHPFYCRTKQRVWNNELRKYDNIYTKPIWIDAKDLDSNTYIGFPIKHVKSLFHNFQYTVKKNQYITDLEPIQYTEDLLYFLGFYTAEGWRSKRVKKNGRQDYRIYIACNRKEYPKIKDLLDRLGYKHYIEDNGKNCLKLHILDRGLWLLTDKFGNGAKNKHIPEFVYSLPDSLSNKYLEGLIDGDGFRNDKYISLTTISEELARDVQRLILYNYKRLAGITKTTRPKKCIIEGREVNQNDTYQLRFNYNTNKFTKYFVEDEYIWIKVDNNEKEFRREKVYNLEVERDNSYCVGTSIVHNCQAFSVAGKRGGFEDTRGTLFFEIARIIKVKKPSVILLENVKGLLNHNKGETFKVILQTLDELGYSVEWMVLNSKFFGVPQNRERVFIIGYLTRQSRRQILPFRENAGEISDVPREEIKNPLKEKTEWGWHLEQNVYDVDGQSRSLKAGGGSGNYPRIISPCITTENAHMYGNNVTPGQTKAILEANNGVKRIHL